MDFCIITDKECCNWNADENGCMDHECAAYLDDKQSREEVRKEGE